MIGWGLIVMSCSISFRLDGIMKFCVTVENGKLGTFRILVWKNKICTKLDYFTKTLHFKEFVCDGI